MTVRQKFSPLKRIQIWPRAAADLLARPPLWRTLRRDARHPIAAHFARRLKRGRRLPVLALSIAGGLLLFFALAFLHSRMSDAVVWTLPLYLLLFSSVYCVIWITQIVALLLQGAREGLLEEVSVIPPGRIFVFISVCKVVLNAGDAIAWLTATRRLMAGIIAFILLMASCIAFTQLSDVDPVELGSLLLEVALFILIIPLEHSQSAVLACLTSIEAVNRFPASIDRISAACVAFIMLQMLSYAFALAIGLAFSAGHLSLMLLVFILARELLISALWRSILRQANAEGQADNWRELLEVDIR